MTTEAEVKKIAGEIAKRYGAAHKASLAKVAHHMGLAKAAHAKGMASLAKAAGCLVDAHKGAGTIDLKKDGGIAGHIASAHDHFDAAGGHMDDAMAHVGSAMSSWSSSPAVSSSTDPGGAITLPSLSELTEGSVMWPGDDNDESYGEKILKQIAALLGKSAETDVTKALAALVGKNANTGNNNSANTAQTFTKEQVDAMVKAATVEAENASLKKQVETLSRLPAGAPRVKVFDFDKSALPGSGGEGTDNAARLGKLIDGVDFDIKDEGDFTKAGSTMIANMIKNGPKFGKTDFGKPPMWDPNFRGRGGTGASRS